MSDAFVEQIERKMCQRHYLSLLVRKTVFGISTRSNTNQAVQPHKMARELVCVFVFAFAKSRFSHDAAHFGLERKIKKRERKLTHCLRNIFLIYKQAFVGD